MIFDTHCHYNLEPLFSGKPSHFRLKDTDPVLKQSWQDHWQKAQEKDVIGALVVGSTLTNSKAAVTIAQTDHRLFATLGIHPIHAEKFEPEEILPVFQEIIEKETSKDSRAVIGIGEIGLDYYRLKKDTPEFTRISQKQKALFIAQLKLATQYELPVVVHVRDKESEYGKSTSAYMETLDILREHLPPNARFVLHCISGPLAYLIQGLEMGAYIGVCANITYKKAESLKELIKATPMNRLLIETDAPYLPPQEFRGKVCEPWMITETSQFLEKEFGIEPKWLLENTEKFFDINLT